MTTTASRWWSALLVLALVSCSYEDVSGTLAEFPFAAAMRSCGPADGPAMAIVLTRTETNDIQPAAPFVHVLLSDSPAQLVGRTFVWQNGNGGVASAIRCETNTACTTSSTARVTIGHFAADSALDVMLDLTFPNAERVRGNASARWIPRSFLCG